MANEPVNQSVTAAEDLLAELKGRAEEAHRRGNVFTLTLMQELIKVTSPIVTKAVARFHREERARINQMAKEVRAQSRDSSPRRRED